MLFNSITFLVFLLFTFIVYWKSSCYSHRLGNAVLLASSYIFYGWWDWRFLILIILSSTTDFIIGRLLYKTNHNGKRKRLLLLSIAANIGILFVFKYFNFFIDSIGSITGEIAKEPNWSTLNIILPVGISFYTFQTLSYTIDIYKQKIKPTKSILTFFTFVAFFPQLVAGPIERAQRLIPQFEKKSTFSFSQASSGLKLMLWGLFKKMVIADQLSVIVNTVYANPENYNGLGIILATIFFGFQIYCDFSGYSDIAIGTARLFGIELMINFRTPYFAASIRDFWHRWHISLSTWFRDYIYIPLGGNQSNSIKWTGNILITFVVSGLWHGASITFIIWGFIHGILFILEQLISPLIKVHSKLKYILGLLITFSVVNFSWLFFRAESWTKVEVMLNNIFTKKTVGFSAFKELIISSSQVTESGRMLLFIFPFFILIEIFIGKKTFAHLLMNSPKFLRWSFYYVIFISILFFGVLNSAPQFIYFQF
jgi:alginate O-acetyltransferase complex protein AlgI